jgi:hypothetical protein
LGKGINKNTLQNIYTQKKRSLILYLQVYRHIKGCYTVFLIAGKVFAASTTQNLQGFVFVKNLGCKAS